MQEEKTLKDKYDTIWDWLGGINQKPKIKQVTETEKGQVGVYVKELTKKGLPLSKKDPISITVYKIEDQYIIDPTYEEEKAVGARLTAAFTSEGKICAMQKGEVKPLSLKDISEMVELAYKKSEELRKYVKE